MIINFNYNSKNMNIQQLITLNKQSLLESDECACLFCLKKYDPKLINEYTLDLDPSTGLWGETAICYYCSVDAIIPNKLFHYDDTLLLKMKLDRFGSVDI
jgi:hypothetical protein